MITEDYVSFEVAKLLKDKGFEGDINAYYHIWDNGNKVCSVQEFSHSEAPHLYIPAPTHQMAMKWLRKVHKILIVISPHDGKGYSAILYDIIDFISYDDFRYIKETDCFFNPEEAVDAAILYSLKNLINYRTNR